VIRGKDGSIEEYRPGSLHLDTPSAEPWITRASAGILEDHGVGMVDAPVSGAGPGARHAELGFMVGGAAKATAVSVKWSVGQKKWLERSLFPRARSS
jgi:3-hydroxyisobutyrate dehydrogenase